MKSLNGKPSLFGQVLNQVQTKRSLARTQAEAKLWKRNKVAKGAPGYKLAESTYVLPSGREVTEYRLYKLIDFVAVTVSAEAKIEVEDGLAAAQENRR